MVTIQCDMGVVWCAWFSCSSDQKSVGQLPISSLFPGREPRSEHTDRLHPLNAPVVLLHWDARSDSCQSTCRLVVRHRCCLTVLHKTTTCSVAYVDS